MKPYKCPVFECGEPYSMPRFKPPEAPEAVGGLKTGKDASKRLKRSRRKSIKKKN